MRHGGIKKGDPCDMARWGWHWEVAVAFVGLAAMVTSFAQTPSASTHLAGDEATREKIIRYVRERFNVPASVKLEVGPFRDSHFPDFYETTITLDDGKNKRSQNFFVSKNRRYLVEGNIFTLGSDPRREIVEAISLQDQPMQGPATAPVTITEYSDLQCPNCALFHDFLEKEVVPKYGNKIRIVFKEFPLVNIHDWAMTAAIASECAYITDPEAFVRFRSLVFQNQTALTADKARDMLLHFGAESGIDNVKLASCIDSKASLPRVEASIQEGQTLGIASTPTSFINGRVVVGTPEPTDFFKIVDDALSALK
jgi:protein-disulfide isomerase